jgi:hypothetical protein
MVFIYKKKVKVFVKKKKLWNDESVCVVSGDGGAGKSLRNCYNFIFNFYFLIFTVLVDWEMNWILGLDKKCRSCTHVVAYLSLVNVTEIRDFLI